MSCMSYIIFVNYLADLIWMKHICYPYIQAFAIICTLLAQPTSEVTWHTYDPFIYCLQTSHKRSSDRFRYAINVLCWWWLDHQQPNIPTLRRKCPHKFIRYLAYQPKVENSWYDSDTCLFNSNHSSKEGPVFQLKALAFMKLYLI